MLLMDRRALLAGAGALSLAGCKLADPSTKRPQLTVPLDLSAMEEHFDGRMGFAFATEGKRGAWRGEERFVYCSTFKMFLAAATLMRVQAGDEDLERAIAITPADMLDHAPVTKKAIGQTLTITQLMKGTVEESDNPAANILIRELGGLDVMRQFYRDLGDTTTRVDRMEPEMNRWDGDMDTILPSQSVRNLEKLILSETSPLKSESKRLLLEWMVATPTGEGRLKAGAPSGWTVAHKTGSGGYGPVNDIGILYPVSGAPIVVAAYFHGSAHSTNEQREAAIAEATRQMLVALGHG